MGSKCQTDGWCGVHFACAVSEMILTKLVQDHGSAPGWAAVCLRSSCIFMNDPAGASACTSALLSTF